MASIVSILVSYLLFCSITLEAESQNFANVECQSSVVAQYGTSTLLNCVVKINVQKVATISFVSWELHEVRVLTFYETVKADPNFEFAERSWTPSNMNVSLLIKNTTLSHAGEYKCKVLTNVEAPSATLDVTVKSNYSKPTIASHPEKISPDKDFTLTCESRGGFPKGDIKWVVNDVAWKMKPEVKIEETSAGLYDMTSTLHFGPDSRFTKFVCEVYNSKGVKEGQETFDLHLVHAVSGTKEETKVTPQIVAPVVVIGSLIVGLLAALLLCRRRRQKARRLSEVPLMNPPTPSNEEQVQMYKENP